MQVLAATIWLLFPTTVEEWEEHTILLSQKIKMMGNSTTLMTVVSLLRMKTRLCPKQHMYSSTRDKILSVELALSPLTEKLKVPQLPQASH